MRIDDFIETLSGDMEPLRVLAKRLGTANSEITDDGIGLSHRPRIAPGAYALILYSPLPKGAIQNYQSLHGSLPSNYLKVLEKLNGAHAFELSLFGIPRSMASDPPVLNRSSLQPYDIGTANSLWKTEYDVPADWFYFGGGPYSFEENLGYFFDPSGTIYAIRNDGEELNSWPTFSEFLSEELRRAENAYPAYEEFMAEFRE